MAGVKGKSGGARPNSGGARPGAGRKPKVPAKSPNAPSGCVAVELEPQVHGGALKRSKSSPVPISDRDMLQLLQDVALGKVEASTLQVRAAIAAVQYTHKKKGEGGKKDEQQDAAKRVASRFSAGAPPRLAAAGGKKV